MSVKHHNYTRRLFKPSAKNMALIVAAPRLSERSGKGEGRNSSTAPIKHLPTAADRAQESPVSQRENFEGIQPQHQRRPAAFPHIFSAHWLRTPYGYQVVALIVFYKANQTATSRELDSCWNKSCDRPRMDAGLCVRAADWSIHECGRNNNRFKSTVPNRLPVTTSFGIFIQKIQIH